MSLEYVLPTDHWFSATINQFPNYKYIKDFVDFMNSDQYALCSNFQAFINGIIHRREQDQQFSSKLIHEFRMRVIDSGKNNELWVKLDNHFARFSLQEFCLITGLPCHEPSVDLDSQNTRLKNQYFSGVKRITMNMLNQAFHLCEDEGDKFKMGLVMIVECVLKPMGRYIDYKTLSMVDQLNDFLQYPWGRKSYFVLLNSLRECQLERAHRLEQNLQNECKYALHGYPLAFQYWIYEAFPQIGKTFGRRRYKTLQYPRMYRWKPKRFWTENIIRQFLDDEKIEVVSVLNPTQEELQTTWCTTLLLPDDNEHSLLDAIAAGKDITNLTAQIPENMLPPGQSSSCNYSHMTSPSSSSNYITREDMERMFNTYRQHIVSDVSELCSDLKTSIIEQQESRYEAILHKQQQLFEEEQKGQQNYFQQQYHSQQEQYQDIQSNMEKYVDTSLSSVRCYIDEENTNMMNALSDWKTNLEGIMACLQKDIRSQQSAIPKNASTSRQTEEIEEVETLIKDGKRQKSSKILTFQSSILEDYDMKTYDILKDWISKNPSGSYLHGGSGNLHKRDVLKSIIDITQDINTKDVDKELDLLRQRIKESCTYLSKEYAILDFEFEAECAHELMMYRSKKEGVASKDTLQNVRRLEDYVNGTLPSNGRPWLACNYLLIPCFYPGNNWYLYRVSFREWKFQIYDCSHNVHTTQEIMSDAHATLSIIHILLLSQLSVSPVIRKHRNKQLEVEIIPYLPCANKGPNCGVFLLKYIECFIFGLPIEFVSPDKMTVYRRKMVLDICSNQYFLRIST